MKFSSVSQNELLTGLSKLEFLENFHCFSIDVTIASGAEEKIRNQLDPKIPSYRLIVREIGDDGRLIDGDTAWTTEHVYLKNSGTGSLTATVIFFE
jgi:hypothetical protein